MLMTDARRQAERQRPEGKRVLFLEDNTGIRFAAVENDDVVMTTERAKAMEFASSEDAYIFGRANHLNRMRAGIR